MTRILVLGGAGFLGAAVADALLAKGHQVHVFDTRAFPAAPRPGLSSEVATILDVPALDRAVEGADVVLHLAGIASPPEYGRRPRTTMDVNLRGSLYVADAATRCRVPVLFASTSEIYGLNPRLPWSEDAARVLGPVEDVRWCYSASKAAAEHYLHACARECGLGFTVVRFFNVYGAGLVGRVVDAFVERALANEPLVIYGDGSHTRCFTYVDDAVAAVVSLVDRGVARGGTFNVGHTEETSIRQLAELVLRITGSSSSIVHADPRDMYAGYADIPRRQPAVDALERECGWSARVSLATGLERMVAAVRARGQGEVKQSDSTFSHDGSPRR